MNLRAKTAVVLGVADRESLGWAIARSFARQGARVTIGYQQKFYSRIRALLAEEPSIEAARCDVLDPDELEAFFERFASERSGTGIDALVHSIAYGPEPAFTRPPSQVNSADFGETLEISAHSLAKVTGIARPHLNPWSSVTALSFQASTRAVPMYGMMGVAKAALESLVRYLAVELGNDRVRVNAISAGPVETLAALSEVIAFRRDPAALARLRSSKVREIIAETQAEAGNEDDLAFARICWKRIQAEIASQCAIPEVVSAQDVADAAVFLASDFSRKMTGQVIHVDGGLSACMLL